MVCSRVGVVYLGELLLEVFGMGLYFFFLFLLGSGYGDGEVGLIIFFLLGIEYGCD